MFKIIRYLALKDLKLSQRIIHSCMLMIICIFSGHFVSAVRANDIVVALSTTSELEDTANVVFSLTNTGKTTIEVLTWNTPLEGRFASRNFKVFQDGKIVSYRGRLVKRSKPKDSDYTRVEPGERVTAKVALRDGYEMDLPGRYQVSFVGLIRYRIVDVAAIRSGKDKVKRAEKLLSNTLTLQVTSPPKSIAAFKQAAIQTSCTAEQTATLGIALADAKEYAQSATIALSGTDVVVRENSGRYSIWFGAYTPVRYGTASTHFNAISSALTHETIEFLCDCNDDYFAYVYPDQPYKIHLCSGYWDAPATGTDSKAGTIIHETSHFTIVAGTDDHVYGTDEAISLAKSTPDDALDNADNHEYFAENIPYLPMSKLVDLAADFGSSQALTHFPLCSLTTNQNGGKETGEPDHAGNSGGNSVWVAWRSPATGSVKISTVGSSFDTVLAVYTGDSVDHLQEIASNDDTAGGGQSEVVFTAQAGVIYNIAVDGFGGATGNVYLALTSGFGDVNGDGTLLLDDVISILQVMSGRRDMLFLNVDADINGDGRIGMEELLFILNR